MRRIRPYWDLTQITHHAPELGPFAVWLSWAQLITWGSVFYTFSLVMGPVERELGFSRADASLGFSLALLADGLMAYAVGRWIDRGHERRAIIIMTFLGGLASTVFIPLSSWLIQSLGWRHALWVLASLQWLICWPLHAWLLKGAAQKKTLPKASFNADTPTQPVSIKVHLKRAPFWLLAGFMLMTAIVSSALPAHMVSLLEEAHLSPAWVIAIPASIGAIQVLGRFLLFLFEKHLDVHAANKWIPCLVPLGLLFLVAGGLAPWAALLFVTFYGLGNGLNTIVKGTAMAQYVSRDHVGQLNGVLGVPLAMGRAVAPWALGLMWTPALGYSQGLRCLLVAGVIGVACLWWAQKSALANAQH